MSPKENTLAQELKKIIALPVLAEFDRAYQASVKRLLNAMKPTDSGSAENSDVLESRINAIREAFDSSDDDETVLQKFGEALNS